MIAEFSGVDDLMVYTYKLAFKFLEHSRFVVDLWDRISDPDKRAVDLNTGKNVALMQAFTEVFNGSVLRDELYYSDKIQCMSIFMSTHEPNVMTIKVCAIKLNDEETDEMYASVPAMIDDWWSEGLLNDRKIDYWTEKLKATIEFATLAGYIGWNPLWFIK